MIFANKTVVDGIRGRPAWSWIFMIEGLLMLLVAFFFLYSFPDS